MMRIITYSNSATSKLYANNNSVRGFCDSINYVGLGIHFLRLQKPCTSSVSPSKLAFQYKDPIFPLRSSSEPQVEYDTTEAELPIDHESKTVHVKLHLQKECQFGERFFLVGDDPVLGVWDPLHAIPMNWSDGHLWTAELDIPVGKTIQFKFILKDISGQTLWQPGPDRVLHTWETENTISVLEDWDTKEIQQVMEEDSFTRVTEQSNNSNGSVQGVQLPMLGTPESPGATQSVSSLDDEQLSMATNNFIEIQNLHGQQTMVPNNITAQEHITLESSETVVAEDIYKHIEQQPVDGLNKSMMDTIDEIPVLIPGLPPSTMSAEIPTNKDDGKESKDDDTSTKTNVYRNAPELDQTQGTIRQSKSEETSKLNINDKQQQEVSTDSAIKNAEEPLDKRSDMTLSAENEDVANSVKKENSILHDDLKWCRETLRKLLTSLRFF